MFKFKQFTVNDDSCAMKVGTDGVLLGAWATVEQAKSALDLGAGSGLISLMLAQRNANCDLLGIELDAKAVIQARENIAISPWATRIEIIQQDCLNFNVNSLNPKHRDIFKNGFDLVVSNPPYFLEGNRCRNLAREQARYLKGEASHLAWLKVAERFLSSHGRICLILPEREGKKLLDQLSQTSLCCTKICEVITKVGKAPQRLLLEFQRKVGRLEQFCLNQQIFLYDQENNYHSDVIPMLRPFYLKL